jgi:hypothetical protein
MKKKPEFHGSDLEKIEEYYHIPKEEIVSFGAAEARKNRNAQEFLPEKPLCYQKTMAKRLLR